MNLDQDLILSFLEEDNIQRAYFRVRPLLTVHGNVCEDALKSWPDEGALRIVPDKNEQHNFKDRMRTLGSYCVVNLVGVPAEANKIRTNKNYRPEKGEINQYILYSDAVQPVPEHTFYQVLSGTPAAFADLAAHAITPLFFICENDTLYGPVVKAAPALPAPAAAAEGTLFTLDCPDGQQRTVLCILPKESTKPAETPRPAEAEAPAEPVKPAEEALPIGQTLNILDTNKTFDETISDLTPELSAGANLLHAPSAPAEDVPPPAPAAPLTGTPLRKTPLHTSVPQPKNKLQEVVSSQWRVARNDPPAEPLPAGATITPVENPVQAAADALRHAWQTVESHPQLINLILSLDGMRAKLEPKLGDHQSCTSLYQALQLQLRNMEAERLSLLVELDHARSDVDQFRRDAMDSAREKLKAEIAALEAAKAAHAENIEQLKSQLNALAAQRTELQQRVDALQQGDYPAVLAKAISDAQLNAPLNGTPLRMNSICGTFASADELIARVCTACKSSGIECTRNHAAALLALLAVCPRFALTANANAAASTLAGNIAAALGWRSSFAVQISADQKPLRSPVAADGTPAVLVTALPAYAPLEGICKIMLARSAQNATRNIAYETTPWPVYPLGQLPFIPKLTTEGIPVSAASLDALAAKSAATAEEITLALTDVFNVLPPLSGDAMEEMHRFIGVCAALMDGGLPAALDWAILLWLLPGAERTPRVVNALRTLLEPYPLSLAAL